MRRPGLRRPPLRGLPTSVLAVCGGVALVLGGGLGTVAVGVPAGDPQRAAAQAPADDAMVLDLLPVPEPESASRQRPAPAPSPVVQPLKALRAPDLVVTAGAPLTPEQVRALSALKGVQAVTVADAGTVQLGGKSARALGVDPSSFRAFTPQDTAASDPLWQSVARGELAPTFGLQRSRSLVLGSTVPVKGRSEVQRRIGAVAAYGLPGVDVVTDRTTARSLGVVPDSAVLVSAPERRLTALKRAVQGVLGAGARIEVLRVETAAPRAGRPRSYRELYVDSARYCPGLSWTVLAAIGQVESAHGRHLGPSSAGALGPMQFLPSTWAAYGVDGDGDGTADIMSPYDAVPAAAAYLCRFGANRGPDGLYDAIFAYNHADWYVKKVLGIAAQYR